jgi:chromosome segregation ATPase
MAGSILTLDRESLCESVRHWRSEQEALDAQWQESLAALVAYQSHLDDWQQELARGRAALAEARQQFEQESADAAQHRIGDAAGAATQLDELRQQLTSLSQQVDVRSDELRAAEQQRAELATELELVKTHADDLTREIEEQKRVLEQERALWADELRHMRELLERRAESSPSGREAGAATTAPEVPQPPQPARASETAKRSSHSPVLGSIVEQFGKLRQQRAVERQAHKNGR